MIRKPHLVTAMIVVAGTFGLAVPNAFAVTVPFSARYSGSALWTSPTTIALLGSGTATQLGRVANSRTVYLTNFNSSCPDGPDGVASVNVETLTGADGDTLTIESDDVACPVGPGLYDGTGRWKVTGGTGRFNGASGGGQFTGTADLNQGRFSSNPTGVLTLRAG